MHHIKVGLKLGNSASWVRAINYLSVSGAERDRRCDTVCIFILLEITGGCVINYYTS